MDQDEVMSNHKLSVTYQSYYLQNQKTRVRE